MTPPHTRDGLSHIQQGARCIHLPFMCKKVVSAKQCQATDSSPARNIPRTHSKQKHAAIYHFVGNKIEYFVINYVVLQTSKQSPNDHRSHRLGAMARSQAPKHARMRVRRILIYFSVQLIFDAMAKAIFQEPLFSPSPSA